ncbi:MAG TPA: hypothetical protein VGE30_02465 [Candidatus Saccharimonadales bacterium]
MVKETITLVLGTIICTAIFMGGLFRANGTWMYVIVVIAIILFGALCAWYNSHVRPRIMPPGQHHRPRHH